DHGEDHGEDGGDADPSRGVDARPTGRAVHAGLLVILADRLPPGGDPARGGPDPERPVVDSPHAPESRSTGRGHGGPCAAGPDRTSEDSGEALDQVLERRPEPWTGADVMGLAP